MNRNVMGLIVKREDGSEIVNYDDDNFPSYIYDGWIEPKVTWEKVPHFHEDVEILTVKSGSMAYSVNGKTLVLHEGDTIFINSNQIHYSMSVSDELCTYVIFVVYPSILTTSVAIEMKAIRPITDNPDIPYVRFRYVNEFTEAIRSIMLELPGIRHDPFEITMRFFHIWDIIRKQTACYGLSSEEITVEPHMKYFKTMMHYISEHYCSGVTLDDIAASAGISKSLCNSVFKRYVGESPITYLMRFRARKVAEYLRGRQLPLSEIAALTGFNGVSYMSETFKRFFGVSPREYKKSALDARAPE